MVDEEYEPTPEELAAVRDESKHEVPPKALVRKPADLHSRVEHMPDIHRMLPASPDAEQGVLASMLLAPLEVCSICSETRVRGDFFHVPAHGIIFRRIMELWDTGKPIDFITLTEFLRETGELDRVGGAAFVTGLFTFLPTAANAAYYLEAVTEKWLAREAIRVGTKFASQMYEPATPISETLDQMEQAVLDIRGSMSASKVQTIGEYVMGAVADIQNSYERKGSIDGIATGFKLLDKRTGGMHAPDVWVIAARPSMGKTAFAMNIAEFVAVDLKIPVGVFSLEMSGKQLAQRLLCSRARVNLAAVRDGYLSDRDFPAITAAATTLSGSALHIDDTAGLSIQELRGRARRMKMRHKVGLIVIDYLQLLKSCTRRAQDNRQLEVSEVSGGIKALAKELDIPIIVLAQIDRGVEKQQRKPRLSDLRESGSIEQDADLVAFLTREDMLDVPEEDKAAAEGVATLTIEKQRTGPRGDVPLTFLKEITRFESRAEEHPEEEPAPQQELAIEEERPRTWHEHYES
jgi:replicative DNA helicase